MRALRQERVLGWLGHAKTILRNELGPGYDLRHETSLAGEF
jgi:hypothetical protein